MTRRLWSLDSCWRQAEAPTGRPVVRNVPLTCEGDHSITPERARPRTSSRPAARLCRISGVSAASRTVHAVGRRNSRPSTASEFRHTVSNADILHENPRALKAYSRALDDSAVALRNITKCNLETWRVPLSLFAATAPVVTWTRCGRPSSTLTPQQGETAIVSLSSHKPAPPEERRSAPCPNHSSTPTGTSPSPASP